ncbi:MAG: SDR family NAD(P)-dependent oxidoreductase [Kiritimatiellia bacterium]
MKTASHILITGASSGIGEALARECARRGAARLFLCGRNGDRLEAVAAGCRDLGAEVHAEVVDVTDEVATREWIARCDSIAPLELVFSNAGVGTGVESEANIRRTFATNVTGNLNVVLPVLERFRASPAGRARRQIVVTASIAGYAPLSTCPAYAATKAAMKSWGLSFRGPLAREGIRMNVVCPGFVRSRITDRNTCPMPFFMEAEKAARIILDRVDCNVGLIAFPWPMRLATWFLSVCPWRLAEFISGILPEKNSDASNCSF